MEYARNGMQEKFQVQNILYTTCEKLTSEICRVRVNVIMQ